jgi:hypothetical protein
MHAPEKWIFLTELLRTISPVFTFLIGWLLQSPIKKKPKTEEDPK